MSDPNARLKVILVDLHSPSAVLQHLGIKKLAIIQGRKFKSHWPLSELDDEVRRFGPAILLQPDDGGKWDLIPLRGPDGRRYPSLELYYHHRNRQHVFQLSCDSVRFIEVSPRVLRDHYKLDTSKHVTSERAVALR